MEVLSQNAEFNGSVIMKYYDSLETLEDFQQAREALRITEEMYVDSLKECGKIINEQNEKSKTHILVSAKTYFLAQLHLAMSLGYFIAEFCKHILWWLA